MPLDDVAAEGDQLATLRELRDLLARRIVAPLTAAADVSSLTGRLTAVLTQITELEPSIKKGTALDEFTQRRAQREASSTPRAKKRSQ